MIFVGVEGGGTTTRAYVQRGEEEPRLLEMHESLKIRDNDFEASAKRLATFLVAQGPIDAIAIGLSGMSRIEDQRAFETALDKEPTFQNTKIHIEGDGTLTLQSAIPDGEEGILLIIGTGSVVYYKTLEGNVHRIGGWGPLLSDEGSGYRIGLHALRKYVAYADGVDFPDAVTECVTGLLSDELRQDRRTLAKRAERDPAFVASFAKPVFEIADSNEEARHMIWTELFDVPNLISPILTSNVLSSNRPYTLYLAGTIGRHPFNLVTVREAFDLSDIRLQVIEELAPCLKALEIAKVLA
jgi:N-acetylglucosamine kinase-like BadF-type ATPase